MKTTCSKALYLTATYTADRQKYTRTHSNVNWSDPAKYWQVLKTLCVSSHFLLLRHTIVGILCTTIASEIAYFFRYTCIF
jgi:hypothetical protein